MKGMTKERLVAAINEVFDDGDTILEDSTKLDLIWKERGDDWFIEGGRWVNVTEERRIQKEWR